MFDQFYHTRCSAQDSLMGDEGFTLRAASLPIDAVRNRRLDLTLADLSHYELPIGLRNAARSGDLPIDRAPIRLARLRFGDSQFVLVHSVYRSDAGQRVMSYFTHVVLPTCSSPQLGASAALALWGAEQPWGGTCGWVWRDAGDRTTSNSKMLPSWQACVPEFTPLVDDDSVACFLSGGQVDVPIGSPGIEVTPKRLQGPANEYHRSNILVDLVSNLLRNRRTYLVAEPGLAALLIYAATRILPPPLTHQLTFSTYEPIGALAACQLDIINTVPDSYDGFADHLANATRSGTVIDTYRPRPPAIPTHSDAGSTFGQFAVHALKEGCRETLESCWATAVSVLEADRYDGPSFCSFWLRYRKLQEIDHSPLPEQELRWYLANPRWRALLFESPAGRLQAVALAADSATLPDWWPQSPTDQQRIDVLCPWLQEIRELLIERTVSEFKHPSDTSQHLNVAKFCLTKLLPPLTDSAYTQATVLDDVVNRLEVGCRDDELCQRLPWTTRLAVLKRLSVIATSRFSVNGPSDVWLTLNDADELLTVIKANLPVLWRAKALANWISRHHATANVASLLTSDAKLLTHFTQQLALGCTSNDLQWHATLIQLFTALGSLDAKVVFLRMLLESPHLQRTPDVQLLYHRLLADVADAHAPWQHFFRRDPSMAGDLIDQLALEDQQLFWQSCWRTLDTASLFPKHDQHQLLRTLLKRYDSPQHRSIATDAAIHELAAHWRRVYGALYDIPPSGTDWFGLRWSLKALSLDPYWQQVVRRLVYNVTRVEHSSEDIVQVVECAASLLPDQFDVETLVECLITSTLSLNDESVQTRLLAAASRRAPVHFRETLVSRNLGLADHQLEYLVGECSVDTPAARDHGARGKPFLLRYASALALALASAVIVTVLFLVTQPPFVASRGALACAALAMYATALAAYEAWSLRRLQQYPNRDARQPSEQLSHDQRAAAAAPLDLRQASSSRSSNSSAQDRALRR